MPCSDKSNAEPVENNGLHLAGNDVKLLYGYAMINHSPCRTCTDGETTGHMTG